MKSRQLMILLASLSASWVAAWGCQDRPATKPAETPARKEGGGRADDEAAARLRRASGPQLPEEADAPAPAAAAFVGRWRVLSEGGETACYFTLADSFDAKKSHAPDVTGRWEVVGSEARITWSDGWKDAIRHGKADGVVKDVPGSFVTAAFEPGKDWADEPAHRHRAVKEVEKKGGRLGR